MCNEVEKLLFEYRSAALEHTRMSAEAPKKANDAADKMATIWEKIRDLGSDAQQSFLLLLDNNEPEVQCWAASHALAFAPDKASTVLEKLASGQHGMISFDAQMTLQEWKSGRLNVS